METKSFPTTELKALPEKGEGVFEALVAVFGNVDRGGDRIEKGAFKRTLEERGLPPIIWSHNWDIPPIGTVTEAKETDEGLEIKGRLFVGSDEDHPVARQVYTAMRAQDGNGTAPLREFSFGYEVRDSSEEKTDGETVRVLEDVELFEVGPTLVGMNPQTRLLAVKSAEQVIEQALSESTSDPTPDDKPEPKEQSEEDRARIRRVLAAQPIHLPEKE